VCRKQQALLGRVRSCMGGLEPATIGDVGSMALVGPRSRSTYGKYSVFWISDLDNSLERKSATSPFRLAGRAGDAHSPGRTSSCSSYRFAGIAKPIRAVRRVRLRSSCQHGKVPGVRECDRRDAETEGEVARR